MRNQFEIKELNFIDGLNFLSGIAELSPTNIAASDVLTAMQWAIKYGSPRRKVADLLSILFGVSVDLIAVLLTPADVLSLLEEASHKNPSLNEMLRLMLKTKEVAEHAR